MHLPCRVPQGFLSTPSARRATQRHQGNAVSKPISIHALREEGDTFQRGDKTALTKFLSTPSARRATIWRYHDA